MTSVFQLYGRPLAENDPLPPLMIVGSLPSYEPGNSYEGRLDILNAVGKCTAEIVESSLPPGAYVFVDNFTKEVVLAWPAYTPPTIEASAIPNGDFEAGDDGSWRKGAGWTIEAGGAESGTYSAVFANHRGASSIESVRVPYNGETITTSARFQQGASSEGNLAGRVLLIWCDADGNTLPGGEGVSYSAGNIIRSGSNGAWSTSSVTAASNNPNAKTVAVGFTADRKKQNKLARVDNFVWNHSYQVGTEDSLDYTVTIKVTDSANRVAYWTGSLYYGAVWLTSKLYGIVVNESIGMAGGLSSLTHKQAVVDAPPSTEPVGVGGQLVGFSLRPATVEVSSDEPVGMAGSLVGFTLTLPVIPITAPVEPVGMTGTLQAFSLRQQPVVNTQEPVGMTGSIQSFYLGP